MFKVPGGVGILLPSVVRTLAGKKHLAKVTRVVIRAHRVNQALRQVVVGHAILAAVHDYWNGLRVLTCLANGLVLAGLEPKFECVVESLRLGLYHFLGGRGFYGWECRLAALVEIPLAYDEASVAMIVGLIHDGVVKA